MDEGAGAFFVHVSVCREACTGHLLADVIANIEPSDVAIGESTGEFSSECGSRSTLMRS